MTENTNDATQAPAAEVPAEANAEKPKRKNPGPRLTVEEPGQLATLEAQWLKDTHGVEVTPSQVRAILMYHGEFQKSDVRKAQRAEIDEQRKADRERRDAERKERQARLKAAEAEAKAAKEAEKEANPQGENASEQPKRTSALKRNRNSKKQEPVGANAEF